MKAKALLCTVLGIFILLAELTLIAPIFLGPSLGFALLTVKEEQAGLESGSLVLIEAAVPEDVVPGERIVFLRDGTQAVGQVRENRLVVGEYVLVTDTEPETCPYSHLMGKVWTAFPLLGSLMPILASTLGQIYALLLALCGVMLLLLSRQLRDRESRRLRRELEKTI